MDNPSRAVYLFPAVLLVAGVVYVISSSRPRTAPLPLSRLPIATSQRNPADDPVRRPDRTTRTAGRRSMAGVRSAMTRAAIGRSTALSGSPSVSGAGRGAHNATMKRLPPTGVTRQFPTPPFRLFSDEDTLAVADGTISWDPPIAAPQVAPIAPEVASQTPPLSMSSPTPVEQATPAPAAKPAPAEEKTVADAGPRQAPSVKLDPQAVRAAFAQANRMVEQGKRLAEKRALHSARTEFRQALRLVAETMDRTDNGQRRLALRRAFTALKEAEELFAMTRRGETIQLNSLVLTHETPLLHGKDCSQLTPRAAMEIYFDYAEKQLAAALQGAPSSSNALFFLGKLQMSLAETPGSGLAGPKSIAYLQAALNVYPKHHYAANELGVLLARYGQWSDARDVLRQGLRARPTYEAWLNLAKVHDALNESNLAKLARDEATWLASSREQQQPLRASRDINQMVTWLPPEDFVGASPTSVAAGPSAAPPLTAAQQAVQQATQQQAVQQQADRTGPAGSSRTQATAVSHGDSTTPVSGNLGSPWRQPTRP